MLKKVLFSCSFLLSLLLTGCSNHKANSIAIIGGADGPTSILITSKTNWWYVWSIVVVIIIIGVIGFIKKRR